MVPVAERTDEDVDPVVAAFLQELAINVVVRYRVSGGEYDG